MKRAARRLVALTIVGAAGFWWTTRPEMAHIDVLAGLTADAAAGEQVFYAGGCAGCHATPEAKDSDRLILGGGQAFASPFGTFYAPNISPHPDLGIGTWTALDLYNAMHNGTSPDGTHYFPAFPYSSYTRATAQDIVSLHAFLQTLPVADAVSKPHDVGFPFNIRRSLGGWKFLFLKDGNVLDTDLNETEQRGQYLVEALGHCGECHTARNLLGGLKLGRWLGGAQNPTGKGSIPNITPGKLQWSEGDIAEYLSSGFTPDFDTAGGHMVNVIENTSKLPASDRSAIAAYLKRVTPVE